MESQTDQIMEEKGKSSLAPLFKSNAITITKVISISTVRTSFLVFSLCFFLNLTILTTKPSLIWAQDKTTSNIAFKSKVLMVKDFY